MHVLDLLILWVMTKMILDRPFCFGNISLSRRQCKCSKAKIHLGLLGKTQTFKDLNLSAWQRTWWWCLLHNSPARWNIRVCSCKIKILPQRNLLENQAVVKLQALENLSIMDATALLLIPISQVKQINLICRDFVKLLNLFCGFYTCFDWVGYNKSTTTSSIVSQEPVFPPSACGLPSWPLQCAETSHFNGFLAPEYASQPTVLYRIVLSFSKILSLSGVG